MNRQAEQKHLPAQRVAPKNSAPVTNHRAESALNAMLQANANQRKRVNFT